MTLFPLQAFAAADSFQSAGIDHKPFGKTADGQLATLYTWTRGDITLSMTDYGATIVSLVTPDRSGKRENIVLGFDSVAGYQGHTAFFGCTVGRYANRIAGGKYVIDGKTFTLDTNNGDNQLHGGDNGFDKKIWQAAPVTAGGSGGIQFVYQSPSGDEGYGGALTAKVTYLLSDEGKLTINYQATTDAPTVVNLTNHTYFNLSGVGEKGGPKVSEVQMAINADSFVEADEELIPTGKLAPVEGTAFDFRKPMALGKHLLQVKPMPEGPAGYDHCFALDHKDKTKLTHAAEAYDPASGRILDVYTTQPGVQLYTGNFLDGTAGSGGNQQHTAFCLETQHFPDTPNQPNFPSAVLRPGETYSQQTEFVFRAAEQAPEIDFAD